MPPEASDLPVTFLSDRSPTRLSSAKIRASEPFQPLAQENSSNDESDIVRASYLHVGVTNLEEPQWRGFSIPQGTCFAASSPGGVMRKFAPEFFLQEDSEDGHISGPSTCADSEASEVPQDIVWGNLHGAKLPKCHTTLMIRNIPPLYSQKDLALEWPNNGSYDFFYLPMGRTTPTENRTFAFINFTSIAAAVSFRKCWDKQRLQKFSSHRKLNIACPGVQGKDANMWQVWNGHYNKACQPFVFEDGKEIAFEEAMAQLRIYSQCPS